MSAVMYVTRWGRVSTELPPLVRPETEAMRAKLEVETARCAKILADAAPLASCGDAIPVAPARGPQIAFTPRSVEMTEAGNWRVTRSGHEGRDAARIADAFDVMRDQSRRAFPGVLRRWEKSRIDAGLPLEGKGVHPPVWVEPFTKGQVNAGRDYATLVERLAASGVKCASLESLRTGGGARGVSEAVSADMKRLAVLRRRIGGGLAKDVRRASKGGSRSAIYVRRLVDDVCLGGRTIGEVMERNGWSENAKTRAALSASLAAALDRMQGYDLVRVQQGA